MTRRSGKRYSLPLILSAVTGVLAVCAVVIWFFYDSGIQMLYVVVPVMAVLALVYYLYQREFFVVSCLCTAGILGVWLIQRGTRSVVMYGYFIALAAVLLAVTLVTRTLQAKDGVLKLSGTEYRVFPPNANYMMLYVTCGIVALAILAGLLLTFLPIAVVYALVVAWLLIMAVYYTVRLM